MSPSVVREDDWEICNDEGFVYRRRRKRQRIEADLPTILPDEEEEEELKEKRLRRRRNILLKLREEYRSEIRQWVGLSARLQQMEIAQQRSPLLSRCPNSPLLQISETPRGVDVPRAVIDDLLSQAEAQEEIINGTLRLCDAAGAMCEQRTLQIKQSLFDLPVWGSPQALLASLSEASDGEDLSDD